MSVVVSIVWTAPTVIIPEDLSDERADLLVIDLGTLTISNLESDRPNTQRFFPANVDTDSTSDTGKDLSQDFMLDIFNVQSFLTTGGTKWRDNTGHRHSILQPFTLQLGASLHSTVHTATFPALKLRGELPALHAYLTPDVFDSLPRLLYRVFLGQTSENPVATSPPTSSSSKSNVDLLAYYKEVAGDQPRPQGLNSVIKALPVKTGSARSTSEVFGYLSTLRDYVSLEELATVVGSRRRAERMMLEADRHSSHSDSPDPSVNFDNNAPASSFVTAVPISLFRAWWKHRQEQLQAVVWFSLQFDVPDITVSISSHVPGLREPVVVAVGHISQITCICESRTYDLKMSIQVQDMTLEDHLQALSSSSSPRFLFSTASAAPTFFEYEWIDPFSPSYKGDSTVINSSLPSFSVHWYPQTIHALIRQWYSVASWTKRPVTDSNCKSLPLSVTQGSLDPKYNTKITNSDASPIDTLSDPTPGATGWTSMDENLRAYDFKHGPSLKFHHLKCCERCNRGGQCPKDLDRSIVASVAVQSASSAPRPNLVDCRFCGGTFCSACSVPFYSVRDDVAAYVCAACCDLAAEELSLLRLQLSLGSLQICFHEPPVGACTRGTDEYTGTEKDMAEKKHLLNLSVGNFEIQTDVRASTVALEGCVAKFGIQCSLVSKNDLQLQKPSTESNASPRPDAAQFYQNLASINLDGANEDRSQPVPQLISFSFKTFHTCPTQSSELDAYLKLTMQSMRFVYPPVESLVALSRYARDNVLGMFIDFLPLAATAASPKAAASPNSSQNARTSSSPASCVVLSLPCPGSSNQKSAGTQGINSGEKSLFYNVDITIHDQQVILPEHAHLPAHLCLNLGKVRITSSKEASQRILQPDQLDCPDSKVSDQCAEELLGMLPFRDVSKDDNDQMEYMRCLRLVSLNVVNMSLSLAEVVFEEYSKPENENMGFQTRASAWESDCQILQKGSLQLSTPQFRVKSIGKIISDGDLSLHSLHAVNGQKWRQLHMDASFSERAVFQSTSCVSIPLIRAECSHDHYQVILRILQTHQKLVNMVEQELPTDQGMSFQTPADKRTPAATLSELLRKAQNAWKDRARSQSAARQKIYPFQHKLVVLLGGLDVSLGVPAPITTMKCLDSQWTSRRLARVLLEKSMFRVLMLCQKSGGEPSPHHLGLVEHQHHQEDSVTLRKNLCISLASIRVIDLRGNTANSPSSSKTEAPLRCVIDSLIDNGGKLSTATARFDATQADYNLPQETDVLHNVAISGGIDVTQDLDGTFIRGTVNLTFSDLRANIAPDFVVSLGKFLRPQDNADADCMIFTAVDIPCSSPSPDTHSITISNASSSASPSFLEYSGWDFTVKLEQVALAFLPSVKDSSCGYVLLNCEGQVKYQLAREDVQNACEIAADCTLDAIHYFPTSSGPLSAHAQKRSSHTLLSPCELKFNVSLTRCTSDPAEASPSVTIKFMTRGEFRVTILDTLLPDIGFIYESWKLHFQKPTVENSSETREPVPQGSNEQSTVVIIVHVPLATVNLVHLLSGKATPFMEWKLQSFAVEHNMRSCRRTVVKILDITVVDLLQTNPKFQQVLTNRKVTAQCKIGLDDHQSDSVVIAVNTSDELCTTDVIVSLGYFDCQWNPTLIASVCAFLSGVCGDCIKDKDDLDLNISARHHQNPRMNEKQVQRLREFHQALILKCPQPPGRELTSSMHEEATFSEFRCSSDFDSNQLTSIQVHEEKVKNIQISVDGLKMLFNQEVLNVETGPDAESQNPHLPYNIRHLVRLELIGVDVSVALTASGCPCDVSIDGLEHSTASKQMGDKSSTSVQVSLKDFQLFNCLSNMTQESLPLLSGVQSAQGQEPLLTVTYDASAEEWAQEATCRVRAGPVRLRYIDYVGVDVIEYIDDGLIGPFLLKRSLNEDFKHPETPLKLDIVFENPEIVFPRNEFSAEECLLVCPDRLVVSNKICRRSYSRPMERGYEEKVWMMDSIQVRAEQLCIGTGGGVLKIDGDVHENITAGGQRFSPFLGPLDVCADIATPFYQLLWDLDMGLPDLLIHLRASKLNCCLSREHFHTLVRVFEGNFDAEKPVTLCRWPFHHLFAPHASNEHEDGCLVSSCLTSLPYSPIQLDVLLEEVTVSVGGSNSQPLKTSDAEDKYDTGVLATIVLDHLKVLWDRTRTGHKVAQISMLAVNMVDERRRVDGGYSSTFRRVLCPYKDILIDCGSGEERSDKNVGEQNAKDQAKGKECVVENAEIAVTMQTGPPVHTGVDPKRTISISVSRPCGFLVPEFVAELASFFQLPSLESSLSISSSSGGKSRESHESLCASGVQLTTSASWLDAGNAVISVKSAKIVLPVNSVDPECRCMVATLDLHLHQLVTEAGVRVVSISCSNGHLFSSSSCRPVMDESNVMAHDFGFSLQVLQEKIFLDVSAPLVSLASPRGQGSVSNSLPVQPEFSNPLPDRTLYKLDATSSLDPLNLTFSYQDVCILHEIINRFTSVDWPATSERESVSESVEFASGDSEAIMSSSPAVFQMQKALQTSVISQLSIASEVDLFSVLLINDCSGRFQPLLLLEVSSCSLEFEEELAPMTAVETDGAASSTTHDSEARVRRFVLDASPSVSFYNPNTADWEAILHRTSVYAEGSLNTRKLSSGWRAKRTSTAKAQPAAVDKMTVRAKDSRSDRRTSAVSEPFSPSSAFVSITCPAISLRLTNDLLSTLDSTVRTWRSDLRLPARSIPFSPYYLNNKTGVLVKFFVPTGTCDARQIASNSMVSSLSVNEEQGIRHRVSRQHDTDPSTTLLVNLKIEGYRWRQIKINRTGLQRYRLRVPYEGSSDAGDDERPEVSKRTRPRGRKGAEPDVFLLVDVVLRDGSKVITLSSPAMIDNRTSVHFQADFLQPNVAGATRVSLPPHSVVPIPISTQCWEVSSGVI